MRELRWTEAEKKLSRRAFEVALQAELADVLQDFKARAAAVQTPADMWPIEHFLSQRRRELDAKYDYRYSQLISVFGRLIREGRLTEAHLEGLSHDKLEFIRRIASL
jgi:Photoprotection regulator fluorescence recovery protein